LLYCCFQIPIPEQRRLCSGIINDNRELEKWYNENGFDETGTKYSVIYLLKYTLEGSRAVIIQAFL